MSYSKDDSRHLTGMIEVAKMKSIDASRMPPEQQINALRSLVKALETGLKIVHERHYAEPPQPEPFPGACKAVVQQGLSSISLARMSGLIP